MRKLIVIQNQTIFDVALQLYGSIEGVFDLIALNDFLININTDIYPGDELIIGDAVLDDDIESYYKNNNVTIVSAAYLNKNTGDFSDDFNCDFSGSDQSCLGDYNNSFNTSFF